MAGYEDLIAADAGPTVKKGPTKIKEEHPQDPEYQKNQPEVMGTASMAKAAIETGMSGEGVDPEVRKAVIERWNNDRARASSSGGKGEDIAKLFQGDKEDPFDKFKDPKKHVQAVKVYDILNHLASGKDEKFIQHLPTDLLYSTNADTTEKDAKRNMHADLFEKRYANFPTYWQPQRDYVANIVQRMRLPSDVKAPDVDPSKGVQPAKPAAAAPTPAARPAPIKPEDVAKQMGMSTEYAPHNSGYKGDVGPLDLAKALATEGPHNTSDNLRAVASKYLPEWTLKSDDKGMDPNLTIPQRIQEIRSKRGITPEKQQWLDAVEDKYPNAFRALKPFLDPVTYAGGKLAQAGGLPAAAAVGAGQGALGAAAQGQTGTQLIKPAVAGAAGGMAATKLGERIGSVNPNERVEGITSAIAEGNAKKSIPHGEAENMEAHDLFSEHIRKDPLLKKVTMDVNHPNAEMMKKLDIHIGDQLKTLYGDIGTKTPVEQRTLKYIQDNIHKLDKAIEDSHPEDAYMMTKSFVKGLRAQGIPETSKIADQVEHILTTKLVRANMGREIGGHGTGSLARPLQTLAGDMGNAGTQARALGEEIGEGRAKRGAMALVVGKFGKFTAPMRNGLNRLADAVKSPAADTPAGKLAIQHAMHEAASVHVPWSAINGLLEVGNKPGGVLGTEEEQKH